MLRRWIKILPCFIVFKIAKWTLPAYQLRPKEIVVGYQIDKGEWLFIAERKYKDEREKQKKKEEERRQKKLRKARKKLYELLNDSDIRDELKKDLKVLLEGDES